LRDRLVLAGLLNLLGSPFWVCHQVLIHLLSYYNVRTHPLFAAEDRSTDRPCRSSKKTLVPWATGGTLLWPSGSSASSTNYRTSSRSESTCRILLRADTWTSSQSASSNKLRRR
jgi:hypothetical protein